MRSLFVLVGVTTVGSWSEPVLAEDAGRSVLVESEDDIGFTLDEDWRRTWRRVTDRGGRDDPEGPIQQRFPVNQYPTHQIDMATADYPLGDEREWAERENGARFWVHSYNAVELGNNVSMKLGRRLGKNWRFDIRYDRLYTRDTWSDLVEADFTWRPNEKKGPFAGVSVYPRIEKQDTDMGLFVGYRTPELGEARVRVWGLDVFSNAAYAVATSRGSPLDYLWKQGSVPLGMALELASVSFHGLRSELYVGGVIPQNKQLFTEELSQVAYFEESSIMFGGLLEYKFPEIPLWLGATMTLNESHYQRIEEQAPEESYTSNESNRQARLYVLSVPRRDMRLEAYLRLTERPEEVTTELDPTSFRKDSDTLISLRHQWLFGRTLGTELSYWFYARDTEGPPDVSVDGSGHRIATRMLWHMQGLTATFGIGWDPAKAGFYDGAGGTLSVDFD